MKRVIGRWARRARNLLLGLLLLPVPILIAYRYVAPPLTPLMLIRVVHGAGIEYVWTPLAQISPFVMRAAIASEDARFCRHHGFDWRAIRRAWGEYEAGERPTGASTITMQTARNLLLWTARSYVRKALEVYLTPLLELILGKRRILELYLNVIEWGDGIYGVEAAARHYFGRPARALSRGQAALLVAILPDPRHWSPVHPTAYVRQRAETILARMRLVSARPDRVCGSD